MTASKYALNVFIGHIRILHIEPWFWTSEAWDNNAAWWTIGKFFIDPMTLTAPLLRFQCTPNAHDKEKLLVWVLVNEPLIRHVGEFAMFALPGHHLERHYLSFDVKLQYNRRQTSLTVNNPGERSREA